MPRTFLNSVNERQKIRGANPEQKQKQTTKQTQMCRCHVAQEQSLAVEKHNFARLKVYCLFELLCDHGNTEGLESDPISTAR